MHLVACATFTAPRDGVTRYGGAWPKAPGTSGPAAPATPVQRIAYIPRYNRELCSRLVRDRQDMHPLEIRSSKRLARTATPRPAHALQCRESATLATLCDPGADSGQVLRLPRFATLARTATPAPSCFRNRRTTPSEQSRPDGPNSNLLSAPPYLMFIRSGTSA